MWRIGRFCCDNSQLVETRSAVSKDNRAPHSPGPTFSFIFSIFLTLERRTGFSSFLMLARVSGERGVCLSSCRPERPICFSSCFSASFSLDSALMLSVLYMWYVFITWKRGRPGEDEHQP